MAEGRVTHDAIKRYVLDKYGLKVSRLLSPRSSGSAGWIWDRTVICRKKGDAKVPHAVYAGKRGGDYGGTKAFLNDLIL